MAASGGAPGGAGLVELNVGGRRRVAAAPGGREAGGSGRGSCVLHPPPPPPPLPLSARRFCTSRQTLAWVPDSFFSRCPGVGGEGRAGAALLPPPALPAILTASLARSLLSGRISSLRDETGAVSEPPSPLLGATGASPGPRPQASRTLPFPSSRSSSTGTPISSPPSSTSSAAKNWTSGRRPAASGGGVGAGTAATAAASPFLRLFCSTGGATSRCCCTKPSSTGSRLSVRGGAGALGQLSWPPQIRVCGPPPLQDSPGLSALLFLAVRRLQLQKELERSSCGSVLFEGYLPPPSGRAQATGVMGCGCLPVVQPALALLSLAVFPAKRWNRHSITGGQLTARPGNPLVRRSNTMPPNLGAGLLGRVEERSTAAGGCQEGKGGGRPGKGKYLRHGGWLVGNTL